MFTKIPFQINYPLEVFHPIKKVDFMNQEERKKLFERNIYYYLFDRKRNNFLEEKHKLFFEAGNEVLSYMSSNYSNLEILNLSLFGSSLILDNPEDYDFLAITQGDVFLLDEPELKLDEEKIKTGISIKGVENYKSGFNKRDDSIHSCRLEQIIDRTAISLFRRHIPLFGYDFINNEREFLNNAFAQVSDLVNNAYDLFYINNKDLNFSREKRAKKLLTRCYEATSYLRAIDKDSRIEKIRKRIYNELIESPDIGKSKRIFEELGRLYEEKASKKIST